MLSEPITLYKLMCLYMLRQVNFPLTNAQLTNFFLDKEYTTYFTLQQALNELTDPELKGFVQQMMNDHQQLFSQFYQLV